ncbi:hypothetical protein ACFWMP_14020 [Paenibacillus sp. NPDC058367]|uniref:AbiTii domain-containing protein n=1 Tax=Paenibacillus sp. NPDC058367 TaxID=3346460 RepID=UPI003661DF26
MSRSQLLKDLVGGNTSIENILLRLKIILNDLENEMIMGWVNGELAGYKEKGTVPKYRILKGSPIGTFIVNQRFKYTDSQVPLESLLSREEIDSIITLDVLDSIATLQTILDGENRDRYAKQISTALCHSISVNDLQIAGMNVMIPSNQLDGIVSHVKSKLVEVILELEKQFVKLDDLDIRLQIDENSSKKEQVIYNIEQIIYEGSIEIGDKNKLQRSKLGKWFGGKE